MQSSVDSDFQKIMVAASRLNHEQPLGRFLIVLFGQFEKELIRELRHRHGATILPSDLQVLRYVDPKGSPQKDIVTAAGISKQAVSQIVEKLVQKKILRKLADPADQRSKIIVFTKKGQILMSACIQEIRKIEARYANILGGEEELERLKTRLNVLIQDHLGGPEENAT